jgi:hypothetical protein
MLLQVAEDLLPIGIRDLGIHFGVLDILVAKMVGHILDTATGFQEVDRNRVAKRMD